MTLKDLKNNLKTPVFSMQEVKKLFSDEPENTITTQIKRMIKRGDINRICKGMYMLPGANVDEFVIANLLYQPSYVSLETVLNNGGLIPDIAVNVTSVTTTRSKRLSTTVGTFLYSKISRDLYYGFEKVKDTHSDYYYDIALKEKALLDLIYVRRIKSLEEYRFDLDGIDIVVLKDLAQKFPYWVKEVLNVQFKIFF